MTLSEDPIFFEMTLKEAFKFPYPLDCLTVPGELDTKVYTNLYLLIFSVPSTYVRDPSIRSETCHPAQAHPA